MIQIQTSVPDTPITLDRPLEHLLACHRRIEERLAAMERSADALADRRQEALEALRNSIHFLMTNGAWHTEDEEQSVFPRLLPRLEYGARARLAQLELQHREAHRLLDKLVALIGAPVPGTAWMARVRGVVGPLAALYREHIAVEEEILIVLCREHLDGSDLAAISDEMRARRQAA